MLNLDGQVISFPTGTSLEVIPVPEIISVCEECLNRIITLCISTRPYLGSLNPDRRKRNLLSRLICHLSGNYFGLRKC